MTGFDEWALARRAEARRDADTYHRTHWDGCHTAHLDCANRRIKDLEAQILNLNAAMFDALGQPGPQDAA